VTSRPLELREAELASCRYQHLVLCEAAQE
jgi:hypothetical protein